MLKFCNAFVNFINIFSCIFSFVPSVFTGSQEPPLIRDVGKEILYAACPFLYESVMCSQCDQIGQFSANWAPIQVALL